MGNERSRRGSNISTNYKIDIKIILIKNITNYENNDIAEETNNINDNRVKNANKVEWCWTHLTILIYKSLLNRIEYYKAEEKNNHKKSLYNEVKRKLTNNNINITKILKHDVIILL